MTLHDSHYVRGRRTRAEVIGRVTGMHELYDRNRLTVRLVRDDGTERSVSADRTQYFSFRSVAPGTYHLYCCAVFGGMFDDILVGSVQASSGVSVIHAHVGGGVVRGRVRLRERPVPSPSILELRPADGRKEAHRSTLDRFGRFFFSGLSPGLHELTGRVPGHGTIEPVRVLATRGEVRLDDVAVRPTPRVRVVVRGPRGGAVAGRYALVVHGASGQLVPDVASRIDEGWLVECPDGAEPGYRIEAAGGGSGSGETATADVTPVVELVVNPRGIVKRERVVRVRWG